MSEKQEYSAQEILDFCMAALPILEGEIRPSTSLEKHQETEQMANIYNGLSNEYPDADKVYWGCRAWQLWLWQPVLMSVWAASIKNVVMDVSGLCHQMEEVLADYFVLPEQILKIVTQEQAVFQTANHLKEWILCELPLIKPHYALSEKLADYFLGDGVLKALAVAHHFGLLDYNQVIELEKLWKVALNQRCSGWLRWIEEEQQFLVEMVTCCQDYRRQDMDYCAGCPKTRKKADRCH